MTKILTFVSQKHSKKFHKHSHLHINILMTNSIDSKYHRNSILYQRFFLTFFTTFWIPNSRTPKFERTPNPMQTLFSWTSQFTWIFVRSYSYQSSASKVIPPAGYRIKFPNPQPKRINLVEAKRIPTKERKRSTSTTCEIIHKKYEVSIMNLRGTLLLMFVVVSAINVALTGACECQPDSLNRTGRSIFAL